MDSSPPLPAHHSLSHPSSPIDHQLRDQGAQMEDSAYSLDMGAMTATTRSAPPSPPALRKIDEVRSEDIDGPSDFTLNMEDWMRGTRRTKKGVLGQGTIASRTGTIKSKGTIRHIFSQLPDDSILEEEEEVLNSPVQRGMVEHAVNSIEQRQRQDDTPIPDHMRSDDEREASATPRANGSSLLDTYAGLPVKTGFLQPTVEDYHSELSPGRPSSAPPLPATHNVLPEDDEAPGLRKAVLDLKLAVERAELRAQHAEEQLRLSQEARKELQCQLDASTEALRKSNAGQVPEDEARTLVIEDLRDSLEQARKEKDEVRQELVKLETRSSEWKTQLEEMRESEDAELHDLRWRAKTLAESEQRSAVELESSKAALSKAMREASELRTQLENTRTTQRNLQTQLEEAIAKAPPPSDAAELQTLRASLEKAQDELAALRAQESAPTAPSNQAELDSARREIIDLREELELLQDLSRLDEENTLAQKHARTASTASTHDPELRAQLDEALRRAAELEKLAEQRDTAVAELRRTLLDSHERNETLASRVALLERDLATDNAAAAGTAGKADSELRESERKRLELHGNLENLRAELDSLRSANDAMDRKVSESVSRREDTWRAKEAHWLKERKVMVKALMRQWGREEVGIDEGDEQRYRYKFLSSPTKRSYV